MSPRRLEQLRPAPIAALVRRMSASGLVIVLGLVLAMSAIIERAVIAPTGHGRTVAARQRPEPIRPRPTTRRKPPATVTLPMSTLTADVRKITSAKLGNIAQRQYGKRPTAAPMVTLAHTDHHRGWAMGTTAIPVPAGDAATPAAALFLAHATTAGWQVALAGTTTFNDRLANAPGSVVPATEKAALRRYGTAATEGAPTDLMLPWPVGQSWTMQSAPGGLAFTGGSGKVVAAGPGLLYRLCNTVPGHGIIMIIHPDGLATTYGQLTQLTKVPNGSVVRAGDYLGHVGTTHACGGAAAPKPTVWFGLLGQPLDGTSIGGWTFHAETLAGFAEHAGQQVMPGGKLANFGPQPIPVVPSPSPTPSPFPSSISPTLPGMSSPLVQLPAALSPH